MNRIDKDRKLMLVEIPTQFTISGFVYLTFTRMAEKFNWNLVTEFRDKYKELKVIKLSNDKFIITPLGIKPQVAHIEYIYNDEYKWLAQDIKYLEFNNFRYYPDGTIEEIKNVK